MSVSKRLRFEIFRRDNHACRYCGAAAPQAILTVDHVVPAALGGSDDPSNLVAACGDCNSGKSSSSPDAALVAEVEGDALRWARARQLAAQRMLDDLARREVVRAEFKAAWERWQDRDGNPVPLPEGWGDSVDRFLASGLPMAILLDCVAKAMRNTRIKYTDLFRYMCGIAWKRVEELERAVTGMVSSEPTPPVVHNSPYQDAFEMLLGRLDRLDDLTKADQVASLAANFDVNHADDEFGDGSPVDYSSFGDDLKAAVTLLEEQLDAEVDAADTWSQHAFFLIVETLGGDYGAWIERGRAEWAAHGVDSPDGRDVERTALSLAVEDFVRRSGITPPTAKPTAYDTTVRGPWGDD